MRYLADDVDEAQHELEASPAVRAQDRLVSETGAEGTFCVVDQIDLTGLRRIEDEFGFGRWVPIDSPQGAEGDDQS